ncbi:hypothetical protein B7Y94_00790 [Candidatus Saccharibacteria bacterium 32-49-12]|nr:MAG: hypothetical protein B7Y94_00790 [Candidatus Saccharibacteria bacterium 32-49-12]
MNTKLLTLLKLSLSITAATILLAQFVAATPIVSQSYATETKLPVGSIASLKDDASSTIIAASIQSTETIIGVVIDAGSAYLSLTRGPDSEAQVATNGIVQVLVSDINGDISRGDHITASPIKGIGMKATDNIRVVGIAQAGLDNNTGKVEKYTDADGAEKETLIGHIPVLVNVSYFFKQPERTIVPSALQNIANALAGRRVEPLPIIIAMAIFIIMLIVVASIAYSMIKSSIISVGRNPLSQSAIYRGLIQMSALVISILGVGLVVIYLILTRL